MKPLCLSSITQYTWKHAALYTLDVNAIMSYYFLYEEYERDYVIFKNVKNDKKHASINAYHATHLSHKFDNHLEVRCSTPHFNAVIIALRVSYKLEWAAIHIALEHTTATLKVIIYFEWTLLHISTVLLNRIRQIMSINWKWAAIRITSLQFVLVTPIIID